MPIYEYRCQDCGAVSEVVTVTVNYQAGMPLCRECLSNKVEKIPSTSAIQFKGSGF